MEHLEIEENIEGFVIIHDKLSNRYFRFDYPTKFLAHGFSRLNPKDTLLPRLMTKDFAYSINSTSLDIHMILDNGTRIYQFEAECEEIFPDEWINLNMNVLDPNVILYIGYQKQLYLVIK